MSKRKPLTPKQLKKKVQTARYKRQAKKIRETRAFGEMFNASSGYDLRSPDKWTPAMKARVTKYAKELGPLIAGQTKTKRYFRKDHLASAIEVSPQERRLPGQKAALFPVESQDEKVVIEFSRNHKIKRVIRGGIEELKLNFDMNSLVRDPMVELERVLSDAPGNFFKFVTGANESKLTLNRSDMLQEMERMIIHYESMPDKSLHDFIYGIKAYPGLRSAARLTKRSELHEKNVKIRERKRLRTLAANKKAISKAELRGMRATGRRGRYK